MDRAGAVVALLAVLGVAASARGHGVEYPKRDTLQLAPQSVTLHIEYVIPSAEESALLSRLFDRDRSGELDAAEEQALREHLCRQADAFVRLEVDGQPLPLGRVQAELSRPGRGELLAVALTLTAAIPGSAPSHALRLFDRHKDRTLAVPVRVTAQGVQLTTRLPPLPLLGAEKPLQLEFVRPR